MKNTKMLGLVVVGAFSAITAFGATWAIDTQSDWNENLVEKKGVELSDGLVSPTGKTAMLSSVIKQFDEKRSAQSITIDQSTAWLNWNPIGQIGPQSLSNASVFLRMGEDDYWLLGAYRPRKDEMPVASTTLAGFDVPLMSTQNPHVFIAPGGVNPKRGGYSGWQSRDMVNWVFHGPMSPPQAGNATTAELVDGQVYLYYDYPNDQDPHLVIDADLTDGEPGEDMGMAFLDPSHGSDCAIIRDLDGNFHLILEDWSPIDASTHAWDLPLAMHAVSQDGKGDFKILPPAVDERTNPTGKMGEYFHPHWHLGARKVEFPTKPVPEDIPQHRLKKGDIRAFAEYEIHEPEQNAFGDWAAISIGGQYYLFEDFVSPGPWVAGVTVGVGVDTNNDGFVNEWTDWQEVNETYAGIPGFAKQVAKTPAQLDLSSCAGGIWLPI